MNYNFLRAALRNPQPRFAKLAELRNYTYAVLNMRMFDDRDGPVHVIFEDGSHRIYRLSYHASRYVDIGHVLPKLGLEDRPAVSGPLKGISKSEDLIKAWRDDDVSAAGRAIIKADRDWFKVGPRAVESLKACEIRPAIELFEQLSNVNEIYLGKKTLEELSDNPFRAEPIFAAGGECVLVFSKKDAAARLGLSMSTVRRWKHQAEPGRRNMFGVAYA